jgi:hypothetical protein
VSAAEPIERWTANLRISAGDWSGGHLELHADGLAYDSTRLEGRVTGDDTRLWVPAGRVAGVRAEGVMPVGRLVVSTIDGERLVFRTWGARGKAKRIAGVLGAAA